MKVKYYRETNTYIIPNDISNFEEKFVLHLAVQLKHNSLISHQNNAQLDI